VSRTDQDITAGATGDWVDEQGLADLLGVSRNHVIACITRGEIPGVMRLGRTVRIYLPAVTMQALGTDLATLTRDLDLHDLGSVVAFLSTSHARATNGGAESRPADEGDRISNPVHKVAGHS
jgi:excisionase family DNA binding protein